MRWGFELKRRYGITAEQYDAILAAQGGGCAICGRDDRAWELRLCVDHDHDTGTVRGILCRRCNAFLAIVENPELLAQFHDYLSRSRHCAPLLAPGAKPEGPVAA